MKNGNAIRVYRTSLQRKTKDIKVNIDGQCPPRWRKRFNNDTRCVPGHKVIKQSKAFRNDIINNNISGDEIQSHIVCGEGEVPCQIRVETNDYGANQQWACCPDYYGQVDESAGDIDRSGR